MLKRQWPLADQTVLIVECDPFLADDLAFAVRLAGGYVDGPYGTVCAALEAVECNYVDIAILDTKLQGEDAGPIMEALSENEIPFVFATSYGRASVPGAWLDLPCWETPFRPSVLVASLTSR